MFDKNASGCTFVKGKPADGGWRRLSHTRKDVLRRLVRGLKSNDNPTTLHKWAHMNDLQATLNGRLAENQAVLQQYQDLFNALLFNGAFDFKRCPIRMIGNETQEWKTVQDHHGESKKSGSTPQDIQSHIRIFADVTNITNQNRRLRIYLGHMLHQMIHAFEAIYVCGCKKCTLKLNLADNLSWKGTGHHRFFFKVSLLFEKWLHKRLGLKISLSRTNAMADVLKKSKAEVSDRQLKAIGLSVLNVRDLVKDPYSRYTSDTECCSEDETNKGDDDDDDADEEDDEEDNNSGKDQPKSEEDGSMENTTLGKSGESLLAWYLKDLKQNPRKT